tara:strand:- start:124 stop:492 length:369 start_codon:yes stop_codon:yes gene_type:complete
MKNILIKFLGIDKMHDELLQSIERVEEKVYNQLDNTQETIQKEVLDDVQYEVERLVEGEVDDKLYNYDFDDMQDKIEMLGEESSGFDNRIVDCQERLNALTDRIDTLTLIERIEKLEEKLND